MTNETQTRGDETMTIELNEIMAAVRSEEYIGFCRTCGAEHGGVEPDACNYECEECGANEVFGAEELLIMGEGVQRA